MTTEQAQFFKDVSYIMGNQEVEIREDYSGRGMYGQSTSAIVCDDFGGLLCDVVQYIKDSLDNVKDGITDRFVYRGVDIVDMPGSLRMDNMGKRIVIY